MSAGDPVHAVLRELSAGMDEEDTVTDVTGPFLSMTVEVLYDEPLAKHNKLTAADIQGRHTRQSHPPQVY